MLDGQRSWRTLQRWEVQCKIWLPAGKAGSRALFYVPLRPPARPVSLRVQAGDCQQVLACFERMKQLGLERNSFTYR